MTDAVVGVIADCFAGFLVLAVIAAERDRRD